jgi:23S rRNA pseudouridine1911/1915/1917 synthase
MPSDLPSQASFPVSPELSGMRLDRALARLLPGVSRTRLQELIRDGGVRVDGELALRPSQTLEGHRTIELVGLPRSRMRRGAAAGASFELLYEDEHLAAIAKPPGMIAHPTSMVQGGTVSELAVARWGELPAPQGEDRPGIVHRLDGDTSGVMVLAKSEEAGEMLVAQFRARNVKKRYIAIVLGEPRFDSDWIEKPIGRSPRRSDRMSVMPEGEGRPAQTFYEVHERFGPAALVECRPRTGRTHQIRVHLASIGHPLVGERVYRIRRGPRPRLPGSAPQLARHALHASAIELDHPVDGRKLLFESPLWEDMQELVDWLRARAADPDHSM